LGQEEQAQLKAAVQAAPEKWDIGLARWTWKVVCEFVERRWGLRLSRSSCLNYLHRLGFVLKRPKKRLLKADAAKREAFVAFYCQLLKEARARGAKIFFVDEAHFWADVCLRAMWVLRGVARPGRFHLAAPGGKGELLLGGVLGDRRSGSHAR
jgi:hypothetical protein